tara:strand:- start:56 stop:283 length:228 start_codon:yes stop_codon:yes gene_type:complete
MFNEVMSAEKIFNTNTSTNVQTPAMHNNEKLSDAVDINHLIARVRKEERKEYKINIIFFGMFALLIFIIGILLTL